MSVTTKIKMIMAAAGVTGRQLAEPLSCPPQTAANKITRGLVKIDDLIKIVNFCGGSITITTKDGTAIPLTLEDVTSGDN